LTCVRGVKAVKQMASEPLSMDDATSLICNGPEVATFEVPERLQMSIGRQHHARQSFWAICATCLPWYLAMASSFSLGCREPSAPARVVAP